MTIINESGYTIKEQKIRCKLTTNETVEGKINMIGHERVSEYLEKNEDSYIKLYNSNSNEDNSQRTIFINKNQILWIEPV